jgi:predicted amidohydrolase
MRAAVVQTDPRLGDVAGNLAECLARIEQGAAAGCDLLVFPECALSGYMLADAQAGWRVAEPIPGPSADALGQVCARTGVHCVIGLLAHPTNSPSQARDVAEFMTRARAAENAVFFLTANRCGTEGGTTFFGWSQIVDPHGRRLAEAGDEVTLALADLDLELARAKTKEPGDGPYSVRLFADRRPDLYGPLLGPEGALD